MGPWWWGLTPASSAACGRDLDSDVLDDRNGEDPVPAASQSNDPATAPGARLQALHAAQPPTGEALVRLAQGFGDCAGDAATCQENWLQAWSGAGGFSSRHVPATLTDLHAVLPGGNAVPLPTG